MVTKKKKKKGDPGTLIRGADGRLYYITDKKLKKHAKRILPKDQTKVARASGKRLAAVLQEIGVANSEAVSRARASER